MWRPPRTLGSYAYQYAAVAASPDSGTGEWSWRVTPRAWRFGAAAVLAMVAMAIVVGKLGNGRRRAVPRPEQWHRGASQEATLQLLDNKRDEPEIEAQSSEDEHLHSLPLGCGQSELGTDYVADGGWHKRIDHVPSPDICCASCLSIPHCEVWTWVKDAGLELDSPSQCWLKGRAFFRRVTRGGVISGLPPARLSRLHVMDQDSKVEDGVLIKVGENTKLAAAEEARDTKLNVPLIRGTIAEAIRIADHSEAVEKVNAPLRASDAEGAAPVEPTTPVWVQASKLLCRVAPGAELPALWRYHSSTPSLRIKVLTYNLFWWNLFKLKKGNGGSAFRLINATGKPMPYDLVGFQECEDPSFVLAHAGLQDQYVVFKGEMSLCMAFRKESWQMVSQGQTILAEDARVQYFGKRAVQWMRLRSVKTGKIVFYANHHGPLPINTGGVCGGIATGFNLLHTIAMNANQGDAVILAGDFNANFASATVRVLQRRLHRVYSGTCEGGIDNFFSNLGPSAVISANNLGNGGSDHDALSIVLELD